MRNSAFSAITASRLEVGKLVELRQAILKTGMLTVIFFTVRMQAHRAKYLTIRIYSCYLKPRQNTLTVLQ